MLLCEEYLQRNNIDYNFIKHVKQGHLIFKSRKKNSNPWTILEINSDTKHERNHSPNQYAINFLKPSNLKDDPYFIIKRNYVQWDEYENFLHNQCINIDLGCPISYMGARLICWEMFLYCLDSDLSKVNTIDLLYAPLDYKLSIKKRHIALSYVLQSFYENHSNLYNIWVRNFMSLTNNYCNWLINYIKNR